MNKWLPEGDGMAGFNRHNCDVSARHGESGRGIGSRSSAMRAVLALCAVACCIAAALVFACSSGQGSQGADAGSSSAASVSAGESAGNSGEQGVSSAQNPQGAASSASASDGSASTGENGSAQGQDASSADEAEREPYVADQVLVQVADGQTAEEVNAYLSGLDFVEPVTVTDEDIAAGTVVLQLSEGTDVEEAVALLQKDGVLGDAQPNFLYYPQEVDELPSAVQSLASAGQAGQLIGASSALIAEASSLATNDPLLSQQWGLDAMNVPEAWQALADAGVLDAQGSNSSITVAVIDEGFNVNHEDLRGIIVEAYNAVTGGTDVSEVYGQKGHGTHVAGLVDANANNGKGVAGVSRNAKLQLVKACADDGSITTATLAEALDHVVDKASSLNTRVVNVSLGGKLPPSSMQSYDKVVLRKIDNARRKGIVTVCSGGNSALGLTLPYYNYPSDYPGSVAVMNATKSLTRSSTSNYNLSTNTGAADEKNKNISAPGTSVYSTFFHGAYGDSGAYTAAQNNTYYDTNSGTSMASPQVAGVMTLMFAANPDLTVDQACSALYSTASDMNASKNLSGTTFDYDTGYGLANAQDAVCAARAGFYLDGPPSVKTGASMQMKAPSTSAVSAFLNGSTTGSGSSVSPQETEIAWKWTSSNPDIATVTSSGVVKGVAAGATVISAASGNVHVSQTVYVYNPAVTGVRTVEENSSTTLSVDSDVPGMWKWSSDNASVAKVDASSGVVKGISVGTAVITAALVANPSVKTSVTVSVIAPDSSNDPASTSPAVVSAGGGSNASGKAGGSTSSGSGSKGASTAKSTTSAKKSASSSKTGKTSSSASSGKSSGTSTAKAAVKKPTWSGASRMPVKSIAIYKVKNGTIRIVSGKSRAKLSGTTLKAKKTGKVKLGLYDSAGKRRAVKTVKIYSLKGTWVMKSAADSSLCLGVENDSMESGANLVASRSGTTSEGQRFHLVARKGSTYSLELEHSGKLVRVVGKAKKSGAAVCQWGTAVTSKSRWSIIVDKNNLVKFVSAYSGKSFGMQANVVSDGARMVQQKRAVRLTQKWILKRV